MARRPSVHIRHEHQLHHALMRVPGVLPRGTITSAKGRLIAVTMGGGPREPGKGGLEVSVGVIKGGFADFFKFMVAARQNGRHAWTLPAVGVMKGGGGGAATGVFSGNKGVWSGAKSGVRDTGLDGVFYAYNPGVWPTSAAGQGPGCATRG